MSASQEHNRFIERVGRPFGRRGGGLMAGPILRWSGMVIIRADPRRGCEAHCYQSFSASREPLLYNVLWSPVSCRAGIFCSAEPGRVLRLCCQGGAIRIVASSWQRAQALPSTQQRLDSRAKRGPLTNPSIRAGMDQGTVDERLLFCGKACGR